MALSAARRAVLQGRHQLRRRHQDTRVDAAQRTRSAAGQRRQGKVSLRHFRLGAVLMHIPDGFPRAADLPARLRRRRRLGAGRARPARAARRNHRAAPGHAHRARLRPRPSMVLPVPGGTSGPHARRRAAGADLRRPAWPSSPTRWCCCCRRCCCSAPAASRRCLINARWPWG